MNDSAQSVAQPSAELSGPAVREPHDDTTGAAPVADPPGPRRPKPGDPMLAFAYACLRREFEALSSLRPTSGELPPPEDIHHMRIATRRLRVALRLFRRMLPRGAAGFRQDFRWFARALSEVRDLDVYAENFRSYLQAIPVEQHPDLGGYELHLRRARAEARTNLGALFGDLRYVALLEAFTQFLEGAPSPAALRRWRSFRVRDGIKKYLKKSVKRVRRLGAKITPTSGPKRLHRLRIRAKRLRYELEFFGEVYPSLDKAAKGTKMLQDMLGAHQDACTATQRLQEYARSIRKSSQSPPVALERLLASQQEKARDARQQFAAEWQRFENTIAATKLVA